MKRDQTAFIAAAFLAAALLWPRSSRAAVNPSGEVTSWAPHDEWWPAPADDEWLSSPVDENGAFYDWDSFMTTPDYLGAFLYMIQAAETTPAAVASGDAYRMLYGGALFDDLSDHPGNLGWKGVPLPERMCRAAGFGPGCVSTAAGAFQIIKPTWNRVRKAGGWGPYLPDFGPASQDEAGRRLLIECGALPLVERGDFDGALRRAAPVWASLPGSTAQQGPKTRAQVFAFYSSALGVA